MTIRLLSPDVSSKIAAGEVIERPSSVVKELIENSLDAGATEVSIEIRGGGVEHIRVADNGGGIESDQVELAFQRFATSKVTDAQDLDAISTLGFRGEALPSIAAVASVSLTTRSGDEDFGTRIDVVESRIVNKESQGAARGTLITVSQLFRNFPARRKFLRTTATENSRIQTAVTRFALAYPEVRFQLDIEHSKAFSSSGSGDMREAVSAVYGLQVAQAMLELPHEPDDDEGANPFASGMISPPSVDRANRSYVSFFVNRRWVQNRMLGYALEQAYHGFLMERRFPLAVVNISIAHEEIDVNVHPTKSEVRFRHDNQVFAALQQAVRQTLTTISPVPEMRRVQTTQPAASSARPHSATFWPTAPFEASSERPVMPTAHAYPSEAATPSEISYADPPSPKKALPVLRVLGQMQNTYVVAEGPDGMYLIDQHAAHERVVFERVRADAASQTPQVQSLLEPATVALDSRHQELVTSHHELISRLGFLVEPFGDSTYMLRSVPGLLASSDPGKVFLDVLDTMAEGGGFESWEERAAYSIACHSAIRAGKTLTQQEMSELARQLEDCQQPNTCPHGRPTIIHLSSSQLEREFGRR